MVRIESGEGKEPDKPSESGKASYNLRRISTAWQGANNIGEHPVYDPTRFSGAEKPNRAPEVSVPDEVGKFTENSDNPPEYDLVEEAGEDWKEGDRLLDEILENINRIKDQSAKQDCITLVVRMKAKGAVLIVQGTAAQKALLFSLLNDFLMLAETEDAASADGDVHEQELLDEIGTMIKKRLGLRVWAVLSKLGKFQEWTIHGDVGVSMFGMLTGSGGLSITFGK